MKYILITNEDIQKASDNKIVAIWNEDLGVPMVASTDHSKSLFEGEEIEYVTDEASGLV